MNEAKALADRLRRLKAGTRFKEPVPKVRPNLLPAERDLIVFALENIADALKAKGKPTP